MENNSAPEPEKKKELKVYSFTRNIIPKENDEETPGKDDSKHDENVINFSLNLYDKELSLIAKKENINPKLQNIIYEQYISLETLQNLNKFFSILDTEKIFAFIQNGFEQNLDHISVEENKIVVKLMINIMEVITEEIIFELKKIKLSHEEETKIIKESIKLLIEEKANLKKEVILLNNTIEEFKKTSFEKNDELKIKLEEKEKKIEENKKIFEIKIEENKKEFEKKMEEKEKEFQNIFKKFQQEMNEMKVIEKYVKEKIIIEQKEEHAIKSYLFEREKIINQEMFKMEITILLLNQKIKFKIKEIQDNLKNNPSLYESDFEIQDFKKTI